MKLIIGGYAQGKSKYAATRFPGYLRVDETNYYLLDNAENTSDGWIVDHLHRIIRDKLDRGQREEEVRSWVLNTAKAWTNVVLISDEIGSGIVPMDPEDRNWRDVTGRILIEIAKESDEVVRIMCGIPMVIKGSDK